MKAAELKTGDSDEKEEDEGKQQEETQDSRDENPHASKHHGHSRRFRDAAALASEASAASLVPLLMERIRTYFDGAEPQDADVDPDLALQLLDASLGDVDVAAGFFWDNYLANASRLSPAKRQQQQQQPSSSAKRKRAESKPGAVSHADPAAHAADADADTDTSAPNDHQNDNDLNGSQREEPDNEGSRAIRPPHRPNDHNDQDGRGVDNVENNPPQQPPPPQMAVAVAAVDAVADAVAADAVNPPAAINNQVDDDDDMNDAGQNPNPDANDEAIAGSVSVSDDEGGAGIWRMERRRRQPDIDDGAVLRNISLGGNVSDGIARAPVRNHDSDVVDRQRVVRDDSLDQGNERPMVERNDPNPESALDDNDHDDSYLSDDDWLTGKSLWTMPPQPPSKALWGFSSSRGGKQESVNNVADEDEDSITAMRIAEIPKTWLHAGFSMAEDGGGLTTKAPSEEDVVFYRWRQQQNDTSSDTRNAALPPYHCRTVTAVLAVVNATMLTGASIQGNSVDCLSTRTPFAELSARERIKQFDERLGDAIAALLFVALKASTTRKQRAIAIREKQKGISNRRNGDFDTMQRQTVVRKLRLCPTCSWHEDPSIGDARVAEAREANVIEVVTSFTNVEDLRSYVKSNLRFFAGKRGCALLLETIVRIHGQGTIKHMVRKSRRKCGLPVYKGYSLVSCSCEERASKVVPEKSSTTNSGMAGKSIVDSTTTPIGHECLTIELLSLLISGDVHSTFHGWSSNGLGFGILSDVVGEVGEMLTRPPKPVWILRGHTCHSVAWVDTAKQPVFDLDQQGAVLQMSHWNLWYGHRNQSGFRINIARGTWSPPIVSKSDEDENVPPVVVSKVLHGILKRKRELRLQEESCVVSCNDVDDDVSPKISQEELDTLVVKEDDKLYYPDDYRRWRYRFEHTNDKTGWKGYHGLNERERLIVDTKLAPRLNQIIWSRWPKSVIDKFTPDNAPLPMV